MRLTAVPLLGLAALAACAPARAAAPRASLPPDSLALLRQALDRVRPAFQTQAEAIRAGVYARRETGPLVLGEPSAVPPAAPPPAPPAVPPGVPVAPPPAAPEPAPARPDLPVPPREHAYVVQIAAYRDEASARAASEDALRTFPTLVPVVEVADGWFRVALAGWPDEHAARAALPPIREIYPSAWVRQRPVP